MTHPSDPRVVDVRARLHAAFSATAGPTEAGAQRLAKANKLYVRERISLLLDEGTFV